MRHLQTPACLLVVMALAVTVVPLVLTVLLLTAFFLLTRKND